MSFEYWRKALVGLVVRCVSLSWHCENSATISACLRAPGVSPWQVLLNVVRGLYIRRRNMQRVNDLTPRPDRSPVTDLDTGLSVALSSSSAQKSLDEIGGEPLAGSGFENEEPESEFAPAGEEN